MKIKVFITGGTIDKEHNPLNDKLVFTKTHIPEILKQGKSTIDLDLETLMLIDSLDMIDSDRQLILEECLKTDSSNIIITHGTDTMVETAKLLGENIFNKTIIMVGAMTPYKLANSDALFNMGAAVIGVQTLPAGIYIIMHGRIFDWKNVRKNRKIEEFEVLKESPISSN